MNGHPGDFRDISCTSGDKIITYDKPLQEMHVSALYSHCMHACQMTNSRIVSCHHSCFINEQRTYKAISHFIYILIDNYLSSGDKSYMRYIQHNHTTPKHRIPIRQMACMHMLIMHSIRVTHMLWLI